MKINRRTYKIRTTETEEEYKQITDDYKYETLIYDLIKDFDLDEKQYRRLNEELPLIRQSRSFKVLFIAYMLVSKIRADGRNYCLNSVNSNLLINYLLGTSKVNPLDKQFLYELPYEPALGISEDPKKLMIQIWVTPDYRQTLFEHLQIFVPCEYTLIGLISCHKDEVSLSDTSFILIPKEEDPRKYGDFYDDGTIRGFREVYRNNDPDTIRINLLDSERMKILDEGSEYLEGYDPAEAFDELLDTCLAESNDHFINRDGSPYMNYGLTFWDFCLSVCTPHNSTRTGLGTVLLKCREDVWKMLERCDLSKEERYAFYKDICRHHDSADDRLEKAIRKTYPYECDTIMGDISNIMYLHTIGASIEDVYNEAKIAWIRKRKGSE